MVRRRLITFWISQFIIVLLITGCSSGGSTTSDEFITAYLPYVENVEFSDQIVEGRDFSITLRFSSTVSPDLLSGLPPQLEEVSPYGTICGFAANVITESGTLAPATYSVHPWIVAPPLSGDANNEVEFQMVIHTPGEHVLRVYSASTPSAGGTQKKVSRNAPYMILSPFYIENAEYQEYTITVLPAEEETEE